MLKLDLPKDAEGIDYAEYMESRKKFIDKKNEISTSLDSWYFSLCEIHYWLKYDLCVCVELNFLMKIEHLSATKR